MMQLCCVLCDGSLVQQEFYFYLFENYCRLSAVSRCGIELGADGYDFLNKKKLQSIKMKALSTGCMTVFSGALHEGGCLCKNLWITAEEPGAVTVKIRYEQAYRKNTGQSKGFYVQSF